MDTLVVIDGGAGNDTISSNASVSILGGSGDDIITATRPVAFIDGGSGDDLIRSEAQSSVLGGDGDDTILGDSFFGLIDGGAGNDTIEAGVASTITLGEGADVVRLRLDLDNPTDTFNPGAAVITDYTAGEDSFELSGAVEFDPNTGALSPVEADVTFREGADGVFVEVNGFDFILLQGRTLEDVNPDDFAVTDGLPATP